MSKSRIEILLPLVAISLLATSAFANVDNSRSGMYSSNCQEDVNSINLCPLPCDGMSEATNSHQTSVAEDEMPMRPALPRAFLYTQNVPEKENTESPSRFSVEAPAWMRIEAKLCLPIGADCLGLGNSHCCSGKCEVSFDDPVTALCVE